MTRDYYNRRAGVGEAAKLTITDLAAVIADAYRLVEDRGHLQLAFGYYCVDAHAVPGCEANGVRQGMLLATGLRVEGAMDSFIRAADEATLFTIVEFIFDNIATPLPNTGTHHSFNQCGWHFDVEDPSSFDIAKGRAEWRTKVNGTLKLFESGFALSESGEVVRLVPDGMTPLIDARLPQGVQATDAGKVAHATRTFHLGRATREERKDAVRALVDILEFHRPTAKDLLSEHEKDLFNIANNFAVRHHRDNQKDDYDDAWLAWMFYVNLATVRLLLNRVHGASSPERATRT